MIKEPELLYSIALMYYQDGLTQQEISKKTNLSRPMVCRALAKAQEMGIVEIKLHEPKTLEKVSEDLKKALNLKKVYIAPSCALIDYAPSVLAKELRGEKKVGIGWGRTIYKTLQNMDFDKNSFNEERAFVPLVSSIGIKEPHFQVNLMVNIIANSLGGIPYFYNPSDAHLKDLKELWDNLDVAVMGLGIGDQDAKGEILGKYFSDSGFLQRTWPGYDAITNEQLLKTEKRICMCEGTEKIESILTASRLGLFNILITDTKTADELTKLA